MKLAAPATATRHERAPDVGRDVDERRTRCRRGEDRPRLGDARRGRRQQRRQHDVEQEGRHRRPRRDPREEPADERTEREPRGRGHGRGERGRVTCWSGCSSRMATDDARHHQPAADAVDDLAGEQPGEALRRRRTRPSSPRSTRSPRRAAAGGRCGRRPPEQQQRRDQRHHVDARTAASPSPEPKP